MNVVTPMDRHARTRPHAAALRWDAGTLSYGELRALAGRMAAVLAARGIGAGERVAILLPNHHGFAIALLGVLWRGAVPVVLSAAWAPGDAARALARAGAELLVTTPEAALALGADPAATLLIDTGDGAAVPALLAQSDGVTVDIAPAAPPAPREGGDVAAVLFSSGTTGDPKGVVLTHDNLLFTARSKIRYCGIRREDRLAMVVPMAHCFGQNVVLLGALSAGACVRVFPRFDPAACVAAIGAGEVTMLFAPPTVFQRVLAQGDPASLRGLRYGLAAAAPLPRGLVAAWRAATGWSLSQGYGLTESSPFATYAAVASEAEGDVGQCIAGVEARIAGEGDGETAASGTTGEILLRGPNVMQGYFRRHADTARALRGGWLHTGDVGWMTPDGTVHLTGRLDDVINVAGFKVWPADVERALLAHPAVLDAAAVGVPDPARGSAVAAAVVLRGGVPAHAAEVAEVQRFAAERLAGFQRPTLVVAVDVLPRSASGKLLRRELAGRVAAVPAGA